MELSSTCFNCDQPIPAKANYYFCSKCFTQLKCKNCTEPLEEGDLGCSNCGTPVVQKEADSKAVNSIEFEQKGINKSFKARFTDTVGETLVASLGGLFLGNSNYKAVQNPFTQGQVKGNQLPVSSSTAKMKNDASVEDAIIIESNSDDLNGLLVKIFEAQDDKISLVNSKLKQSGKRDHAIRITILLLYAYNLTGKKQVKRTELVDILQDAAVYDTNFVGWLTKCDEIKKLDGDLLELNLPGKDAAVEILKEFGNSAIDKGSVHFSALSAKASKSRSKKTKTESVAGSETSSAAKTSSTKMTPVKMIEILINEGYFSDKRRVPEIIKYCKEKKAHTLGNSPLSVALSRMIQSGKMKREKNASDQQYEYFQ